jgi:DNA-binding MarR family transcriptional regulator
MSRRSKRDLFLETMEACRAFTSAVDLVNQIIAERMGVNRTDHRVLEILNRRGAMTAGDLAHAAHLTTGAVTAVVDRLEDVGYVRRVRDTDDRRRVLIEQTTDSTRTAMRYYQPFMVATFDSMTKYSVEELETVRDFMRGAAELSEEYAERLLAADGGSPDAEAG